MLKFQDLVEEVDKQHKKNRRRLSAVVEEIVVLEELLGEFLWTELYWILRARGKDPWAYDVFGGPSHGFRHRYRITAPSEFNPKPDLWLELPEEVSMAELLRWVVERVRRDGYRMRGAPRTSEHGWVVYRFNAEDGCGPRGFELVVTLSSSAESRCRLVLEEETVTETRYKARVVCGDEKEKEAARGSSGSNKVGL